MTVNIHQFPVKYGEGMVNIIRVNRSSEPSPVGYEDPFVLRRERSLDEFETGFAFGLSIGVVMGVAFMTLIMAWAL